VELTAEGSPDLPSILNNLASGLSDRYSRTGELADLAEAIGELLLEQLLRPDGIPSVVRAQILELFGNNSRVYQQWRETAVRGDGDDFAVRRAGEDRLPRILQPSQPVIRYTDLRCPGQVSLGHEFQVTVRLTLRPRAESRDAQQLSLLSQ